MIINIKLHNIKIDKEINVNTKYFAIIILLLEYSLIIKILIDLFLNSLHTLDKINTPTEEPVNNFVYSKFPLGNNE